MLLQQACYAERRRKQPVEVIDRRDSGSTIVGVPSPV
jgi:hypothetical protein